MNDRATKIEQLPNAVRILHRGEHLYRAGMPRGPIYVVTSGCLMSYSDDHTGREHITGFYLPKEYVGLDCLHRERYLHDTVALDTSGLRAIEDTDRTVPDHWQSEFMDALGREIQRGHYLMTDTSAEERFAAFLLDFSDRLGRSGQSKTSIHMPMSRGEIGNYLRLTPSTVSRLVTNLRSSGIVAVRGREFKILDMPRLKTQSGYFMDRYLGDS